MEFNFPKKEGTGIAKLIPHVSPDVQDVIIKMLVYNSDNRMSAGQALKHPCFKEFREADKSLISDPTAGPNPQTTSQMSAGGAAAQGMMRLTQRGADSFSQNSKSMTKFSDNGSEGSYHPNKQVEKYKTTK